MTGAVRLRFHRIDRGVYRFCWRGGGRPPGDGLLAVVGVAGPAWCAVADVLVRDGRWRAAPLAAVAYVRARHGVECRGEVRALGLQPPERLPLVGEDPLRLVAGLVERPEARETLTRSRQAMRQLPAGPWPGAGGGRSRRP